MNFQRTTLLFALSLITFASIVSSCKSVFQTALVIAAAEWNAADAITVLQGYGAAYDLHFIPKEDAQLPALETTSPGEAIGNYGLIIVASRVAYDYGGTLGWRSALTDAQWNILYTYQVTYGVRMIHLNAYPEASYGAQPSPIGIGAPPTEELTIFLSNTSSIPTAGLKTRQLSTLAFGSIRQSLPTQPLRSLF
jgi:hypothetical protein